MNGVSAALNRAANDGPAALRPTLNNAARTVTRAARKADAFEAKLEGALHGIL
jgi:hypothetical protein